IEGQNCGGGGCPGGDTPPAAPATVHLARFHLKSRGAVSPAAGNSSWIQAAPEKKAAVEVAKVSLSSRWWPDAPPSQVGAESRSPRSLVSVAADRSTDARSIMWLSILTSKAAPAAGPVQVATTVTPARLLVWVALPAASVALAVATAALPAGAAGVLVEAAELHAAAKERTDSRRSGRMGFLILRS